MDKKPTSVNKISAQSTTKRTLPSNIFCFSHLRWDFVFQRPQHILTRFAKIFNVYFLEEPVFERTATAYFSKSLKEENLWVLTPHLPEGLSYSEIIESQKQLLRAFYSTKNLNDFAFWYYTPMALEYSSEFKPAVIIYDCMDELSAFKFAPAAIKQYEKELFSKADLVFTGGHSLFEAKQHQHSNIFPFPSSIDKQHFEKARTYKKAPKDHIDISRPRIGFFGVIDERFDIELIAQLAEMRPNCQFVLIGPVVKIDPESLPKAENIHYLGSKTYLELPEYLSGWDIALIPFLINESTQFISPTKTPEYLAAGIPVISTPIKDVVRPYGDRNLVRIAGTADEFATAIDEELETDKKHWQVEVDEFLMQNSWDLTCSKMLFQIELTLDKTKQKDQITFTTI